jgi:hypothetical protein
MSRVDRMVAIAAIVIVLFAPSASAQTAAELARFAVIGDFGIDNENEADVAALVSSWGVDYVLTTGDNSYTDPDGTRYDVDVQPYYGTFVDAELFFPVPGNHDWKPGNLNAYLSYFDYLPNDYYSIERDDVLFIMLSDFYLGGEHLPGSPQHDWYIDTIADTSACFVFVLGHHPFASRGNHGDGKQFRRDWAEGEGADRTDVNIRGHAHSFQRITHVDYEVFVNGSGGANLNGFFGTIAEGYTTITEYNGDRGAQLFTLTDNGDGTTTLLQQFVNTSGTVIDTWSLTKTCDPASETATPTSTPLFSPTVTASVTPTPTVTLDSPLETPTPGASATPTLTSTAVIPFVSVGDAVEFDGLGVCTVASISAVSGGVEGVMLECG